MSVAYPECKSVANGPCQLATSSENACSSQYDGVSSIYEKRYCMCTNGYYSRSSELACPLSFKIHLRLTRNNRCWNGCYKASATTTDLASISRDSRIVELNCESYSLAIESQAAFYSSLSLASMNRTATTSASQNSSGPTTTRSAGGATGLSTPGSTAVRKPAHKTILLEKTILI
jgi:hypothetical protein